MTAHQKEALKKLQALTLEFLQGQVPKVIQLEPGQRIVCNVTLENQPVVEVVVRSYVQPSEYDWKEERDRAKKCIFSEDAWKKILELKWSQRMKDILRLIKENSGLELKVSSVGQFRSGDFASFNKVCREASLPWRIYNFKKSGQRFWGHGLIETYTLKPVD